MAGSAISTPTAQLVNANVQNDGSADSPRGWAIASDANYTFTNTSPSRVRCSGMTAARTVTLPTTNIKAGAEFEIIVSGATETNYVVVNSSGANEVDRIGGSGKITVVALQDAPTTAAHWDVVDVWEKSAPITSGAATGANTGTAVGTFYRHNKEVKVLLYQNAGTFSDAQNITVTNFIPTRFQPPAPRATCAGVVFIGNGGRDAHYIVDSGLTVYRYDEVLFGSSTSNYIGGSSAYPCVLSWVK